MRANYLDPKLITRRLVTASVAIMTAYATGALMMAGIALAGWEYTKRKRIKDMGKF